MLTNPKFLFKYASRSRRENFFRGLDSIVNNIQTDNYQIICSFDVDDKEMIGGDVKSRLAGYDKVKAYWGTSESKVAAINRDTCFADEDWSILINFSDDQIFTVKAFDTLIVDAANKFKDTDFFLHCHDNNQNRLATMSIIGREHFERTGYIYPPDYVSLFCDNHVQEYAKRLGKYYYMGDKVRIMQHLHPIFTKEVPMDEQYKHTESFYNQDKATYMKHLENNFGL